MILEELIYKQFTDSKALTNMLAKFAGYPAVFSQTAPEANQAGWQGKSQYPRLTYSYNLQTNEERNSIGILSVFVECQNTENANEITPEQIEPVVKECLKDVLLKPTDNSVYAFSWARSDKFELEELNKQNNLVNGIEIVFDILEYTSQETTNPDPIIATGRYIKEMYPECVVLGIDNIESITKATVENPIIYCRLENLELKEQTNTVVWLDSKIAIHFLCPDSSIRLKMITDIMHRLGQDGEVILLDKSPMFIKQLQMSNKADYLRDGQLMIIGRYGLLRYSMKPCVLKNINLNRGEPLWQ
jgi:hypothetical protein|nr:MAG TPA: hypothetical protein [Caudoviricetes sp.]